MSRYCLQPETRSALPLVLHDVESSLESRSAVLQNIHILDSSLSWNSIAVRPLWQGCHTAEAKYVPFHDSRGHVMKSHQMKGDGMGIVFSIFLGSWGGWQGIIFSRGQISPSFLHHQYLPDSPLWHSSQGGPAAFGSLLYLNGTISCLLVILQAWTIYFIYFPYSVSHSIVSDSLRPHGL